MKNKNEYPLIYLEWCDAITDKSNWVSQDEAIDWGDNEDWLIRQAAFLLKETKEYLLVAGQFNVQNSGEHKFSSIHKIPKTWIRKRILLTV